MTVDTEIASNKLRNEEFKIWKKTIPLLYQHISTMKPKYANASKGTIKDVPCCLTFSDEVIPNKANGTLSTVIYYGIGNEIYSLDCDLPLGLHLQKDTLQPNEKLQLPQFDQIVSRIQSEDLSPKWRAAANCNIYKIKCVGNGKVVALLDSGAIVWFQESTESPVSMVDGGAKIIPNKYELEEDFVNDSLNKIDFDFDLSLNGEKIIVSQAVLNEDRTVIKVFSNIDKDLGKLLISLDLPGTKSVHNIKFYNDNIFGFCDNSGNLYFYDSRNLATPIWKIENEHILSFAFSPLVETLLTTGGANGIINFWDVKRLTVKTATTGGDKRQESLLSLSNHVEEPISSVEFSASSPSEFITVGISGSIYHWDVFNYFEKVSELFSEGGDQSAIDSLDTEEIQAESLTFYHTGGSRRHLGKSTKKNSVSVHPIIEGLIGTIDTDGLITVYKPFTGVLPEAEDS